MNLSEMPASRRYVIHACALFAIAFAAGACSFVPWAKVERRYMCYALAGICVLQGLTRLVRARRSRSGVIMDYTNYHRAPMPDQIRFFRRMLWLSLFAFPTLTMWIVFQLYQLETGDGKCVGLRWVTFLYYHLGYWPTVLSMPALWALCAAFYFRKLRQARGGDSRET